MGTASFSGFWLSLFHSAQGLVAGIMDADAARRVGRANSWLTSPARRFNRGGAAAIAHQKLTRPSHRAKVDPKQGKEADNGLE
jgi:hypothetical protein